MYGAMISNGELLDEAWEEEVSLEKDYMEKLVNNIIKLAKDQ